MIQQSYFRHRSKENEIDILKRYLHSRVCCSIIHNSQDMEEIEVSIDGWMDEENVMCVYVCVCVCVCVCNSAIKKEEVLPFVTTWMDLEGIMLSELSQTERYK